MENIDTIYWIIAGACVLFIVVLLLTSGKDNGLRKAIKEARKTHDVKPIIAAIDEDEKADIPTTYNSIIKTMWETYDREPAAELIKALIERNDTAPISQYWLKTVMDVEPDIARKQLGEAFIAKHYNEGVASKCGGCGGSCNKCKSCKG